MYIFANPDFDNKPSLQNISKESLLASSEANSRSENIRRSKDRQWGKFDPLDSTAIEARSIQSLFKMKNEQIFLELRANEQNLLSLQSPWRLHIATHGRFLKDEQDIRHFTQPELFRQILTEEHFALGQFTNPLLRSFLALAGANTIGQQQNPDQTYDGIATAYEISGMNLQGTDLVVLSACETGLGDVQNGEGVFGLRRAFQLAGAQTVVMSLWKVPDNETKELMIDFYTRLKNGECKSQALRHAQLAMMRKQREKYGSAHPYFWGAFICAGNPE
jgi:CHAT domain-containing protein